MQFYSVVISTRILTVCNFNHSQLNCASFNKSMAPVKTLNSPWWAGREFFVPWHLQDWHLKQYASQTDYAEPLLQGYLTVPLQYRLCHSCFADVSFYHSSHYSIFSTSVSMTKIQVGFSEESIVYSLIQLTSEEFVSLGLHLLPFHFPMDTWKSHDVSTSTFIARVRTW